MTTATMDERTAKKAAKERASKLKAAQTLLKKRKLREWVLASTLNFSRFVGVNPYDFGHNKVKFDEETGFYPWCPYAERAAAYFDKPGANAEGMAIAKPKYPVFVGRDHFKTTIAECALARQMLMHPEKSFMILCDKAEKAEARLARVASLLLSKKVQDLFDHVVLPNSKENYTVGAICMKRSGEGLNSRAPTLIADGILSGLAGFHFNGVVWMDDIVTDKNFRQSDVQEQLWVKMQQVMSNVASPGCRIWITGTRYHMLDAYRYILDSDSAIKDDIVPGMIVIGCTETDASGQKRPLNFLRFCMDPDDVNKDVRFRGVLFRPIRESLVVKKASTRPISEWYAQMENNPISEEASFFKQDDFEHTIDCSAFGLMDYLGGTTGRVLFPDALPLQIAIIGDPAYGGNDSAVLMAVACDRKGTLFLMNGFSQPTKDLRGYFMKALSWRDEYAANRPFGIEIHAKEASKTLCEEIAMTMGVRRPDFFPLKDNAIKSKEARVQTLAAYLATGKLFFCNDFPPQVRRKLTDEAIQFPNGQHDDTIDTLANAIQVFQVNRGDTRPQAFMATSAIQPRSVRRFLS